MKDVRRQFNLQTEAFDRLQKRLSGYQDRVVQRQEAMLKGLRLHESNLKNQDLLRLALRSGEEATSGIILETSRSSEKDCSCA